MERLLFLKKSQIPRQNNNAKHSLNGTTKVAQRLTSRTGHPLFPT
jgi:hypothetical protein